MDSNHWLLCFLWISYCTIHSLLAAGPVKLYAKKISGNFYRYYRLAYTVLAAVSLLFILYFQYLITSPSLLMQKAIKYISLIVLVFPGFTIMVISILKYFNLLSGIRSLYEARPPAELLRGGIHDYVRHPLYLGTLLFIWGLFFIFPMLNNLIAVVIITGYVFIGISLEEKKLLIEFGNTYSDYKKRVPMLIPDLKGLKQNKKGRPSGSP